MSFCRVAASPPSPLQLLKGEGLVSHVGFLHRLPDNLVAVWSELLLLLLLDALCLGRKLVTGAPCGEHGSKPLCLLLRVRVGGTGQRRRLSSRSSTAGLETCGG